MRAVEVVVVAVLASSCGHVSPVINTDTSTTPGVCHFEDECPGGSGAADTAMTIVTATALLGILAIVIVHGIAEP
jgi:hypothetical protein